MRRGQAIHINAILGMFIFITAVAAAIVLSQTALQPSADFSGGILVSARQAVDAFQDGTSWTVHRVPIVLHGTAAIDNYPVTVDLPFPGDIVAGSVLLMDGNQEIPSYHNLSTNETVFVTRLRNGPTSVNLVYETALHVPDRDYTYELRQSGNWLINVDWRARFSGTGVAALRYKGLNLLNDTIDLGGNAGPRIDLNGVRANVSYPGLRTIAAYDNVSLLDINERFTGSTTWVFRLNDNLTTLYSAAGDTTTGLTGSGTLYYNRTDFVDLYSAHGMSVIAKNMTVNVSRNNGPLTMRITVTADNGRKRAWIVLHDGNYTNAQPYHKTFSHPPQLTVGVPEPRPGISRERATELEQRSYEYVQNILGLNGLAYNITAGHLFTKGRVVQPAPTVTVIRFPVAVRTRFGNATQINASIRVWPE